MTRLHRANYPNNALAPYNFALITDFFNASAYLHWSDPSSLITYADKLYGLW